MSLAPIPMFIRDLDDRKALNLYLEVWDTEKSEPLPYEGSLACRLIRRFAAQFKAVRSDEYERLEKHRENLVQVDAAGKIRPVFQDTELTEAKALMTRAADLINHALGLGHLGTGSTAGWARDVLIELKKFRDKS